MNTWISKHLIGVALVAALAGCAAPGPDAGRGLTLFDGALFSGTPQSDLTVLGDGFTVTGPDGYCVDRPSSRPRADRPFVLMAPCSQVRGGVVGLIFRPRALLTATVTEGAGPTAQGYARFFADPAGLAALSNAGDATGLEIETSGAAPDGSFRVTVFEESGNGRATALVDARSWRAFVTVNGHLVALNLRSPQDAPLSAEAAQRLLDETVAALQTANPAALETADQS